MRCRSRIIGDWGWEAATNRLCGARHKTGSAWRCDRILLQPTNSLHPIVRSDAIGHTPWACSCFLKARNMSGCTDSAARHHAYDSSIKQSFDTNSRQNYRIRLQRRTAAFFCNL